MYKELLVFDIGANEGFISEAFLKHGWNVVAVEPDKRCQKVLKVRYSKEPKFYMIAKAVSDFVGESYFFVQSEGSAVNTLSEKWRNELRKGACRTPRDFADSKYLVGTTSLAELIVQFGVPTFLKVDVEGSEREVFKTLNQQLPLLSFEANLPEFYAETIEIIEMLGKIDIELRINYSFEFCLQLENFIGQEEFKELLPQIPHESIDIICKMSNYKDYYHEDENH